MGKMTEKQNKTLNKQKMILFKFKRLVMKKAKNENEKKEKKTK